MIFFLIVWVIALHLIGSFMFLYFIDSVGKEHTRNLMELPRWLRIVALCFWPYVVAYWLATAKKYKTQ